MKLPDHIKEAAFKDGIPASAMVGVEWMWAQKDTAAKQAGIKDLVSGLGKILEPYELDFVYAMVSAKALRHPQVMDLFGTE